MKKKLSIDLEYDCSNDKLDDQSKIDSQNKNKLLSEENKKIKEFFEECNLDNDISSIWLVIY
jgi:hypothetical protein